MTIPWHDKEEEEDDDNDDTILMYTTRDEFEIPRSRGADERCGHGIPFGFN